MDLKYDEELKEFLANYDNSMYKKPSCTSDIAVFSSDYKKILLITRKNHPWKNCLSLPGGFMEIDETLEEAALRELREETSLDFKGKIVQIHTFSQVDRDPRARIISTLYVAVLPKEDEDKITANDDASDVKWFDIDIRDLKYADDGFTCVIDLHNRFNRSVFSVVNADDSYDIKLLQGTEIGADHKEGIVMALRYLCEI